MNSMSEKSPLSIDRDRVSVLLLINSQLFKRAIHIYNNILINQQVLSKMALPERQKVVESYQHYTRRIHGNLQVLTYVHEKYHLNDPTQQTSKTAFPLFITAPPDMPELTNLYLKLAELYPEAVQFARMKGTQIKGDPSRAPQPQTQAPPQPQTHTQPGFNDRSNASSIGGNGLQQNLQGVQQNAQGGNGPMNGMINGMNMPNNGMNMRGNIPGNNQGNNMQSGNIQSGSINNDPRNFNNVNMNMNMNQMNSGMGMSPSNTSNPMSSMNSPMVTNMAPNGNLYNKNLPMNNMNLMNQQPNQPQQPPPQQQQPQSQQNRSDMNFYPMNEGSPGMLDFFN